jgi:hypothetical protein
MCVAGMSAAHVRMMLMEVRFGQPDRPFTVPLLTDSASADAISSTDRDTKRTRHIERRFQYVRNERRCSRLAVDRVNGDRFQIADLGTKNLSASEVEYKMSILEVDVPT